MTEPSASWRPPAPKTVAVFLGVATLFNLPLLHYFLWRGSPEAPLALPYSDDFSDERSVATNYWSGGAQWRVVNGELFGPGPKNSPLWLKAALPQDVVVELDVRAASKAADVHLHLFGDGVDAMSGYVLVHGAGGGAASSMGRLGTFEVPLLEQRLQEARAKGSAAVSAEGLATESRLQPSTAWRLAASAPPPVPGQVTHHRIEREGRQLRWFIDGQVVGTLDDPLPLFGRGHDRLGLSGWETDLYFDNLRVTPLVAARLPSSLAQGTAVAAPAAPLAEPYFDDFGRGALGDAWQGLAAGQAQLVDGTLRLSMMHNRPLWLGRPLPDDARIEFSARSLSPEGDLKVEAWGDGVSGYSGDLRAQYTSTGYVFIFGGWRNTLSVLASQHEHATDRVSRGDVRVEPGRWYRWTIERRGGTVRWLIDGQPFLERTDPNPLTGPGHRFLGLSGWETTVEFDDVRVTPLN